MLSSKVRSVEISGSESSQAWNSLGFERMPQVDEIASSSQLSDYDFPSSPASSSFGKSWNYLSFARYKRKSLKPFRRNIEPSVSFNTCPLRNAMYLDGVLEEMDSSDALLAITEPHSLLTFPRLPVAPAKPKTSALTAEISKYNVTANPFTKFKTSAAPAEGEPHLDVRVYFPYAQQPHSQHMKLTLKHDATVQDLIGLALCTYCERSWLPIIPPKQAESRRLSNWNLYLVDRNGFLDFQDEAPNGTDRLELLSIQQTYALIRRPDLGRYVQGRSDLIHRRHTSLPNKNKQRWHGRHLSLPFFQPDCSVGPTTLSVVVLSVPSHDKDPTTPPDEVQLEVPSHLRTRDILRLACQNQGLRHFPPDDYCLLVADHLRGLRSVPLDLLLSESEHPVFILAKRKVETRLC